MENRPAAYWAGFFDGEGNIYICPNLKNVRVQVTQKETPILYLLKASFGGNVYKGTRAHIWKTGSIAEVVPFLQMIQPYCAIKSKEIEIALEFLSKMSARRNNVFSENRKDNSNRSGLVGKPPLSDEELERRRILRAQFYVDRAEPKIITQEEPRHA